MTHPVLDHDGPWTELDYLALASPAGDGRVELVDGALIVGPGTTPHGARVLAAVRAVIEAVLPDGLQVLGRVPLRLGHDCVLAPDLVIARASSPRAEDADGAGDVVLDAAEALMVVEVLGCEHGATDRVFKPQLYARSRIPYSVQIDHDVPFAVASMVIGGRYHEYARAADGDTLRVEEPFGLDIDLVAVCGTVSAARGDHH